MRRLLWLPFLFATLLPQTASAQESLQERLKSDRMGYLQPGAYVAGDRISFTLDQSGQNYLLRFDSSPEVFVLYQDHAAMGGRMLKYDSGETALSVSGWGGATLYMASAPDGLPVERTGDSAPLALQPTSMTEIQDAVSDESQHLSHARRLDLGITANWGKLSADPQARIVALEALENAGRSLDRFTASPAGRNVLIHRVDAVLLEEAPRPEVSLRGRTLVVSFNPGQGFAGSASSRVIGRALTRLLAAQQSPS